MLSIDGRRGFERWLPIVIAATTLVVFFVEFRLFRFIQDDSYITYVYSRNWAEGNGFVFNLGERVEGYTCFLWVVLSAGAFFLGIDITIWSDVLCCLATLGTAYCATCIAQEFIDGERKWIASLAGLIIGGYPPIAHWAGSGMETSVFAFFVTAGLWRHLTTGSKSIGAPIWFLLAALTRPEGCLFFGLTWLDGLRSRDFRGSLRGGLLFGVPAVAYFAWRYWYYGFPLPNTFYAKVSGIQNPYFIGAAYLVHFVVWGGGIVLIPAAVIGMLRRRGKALTVSAIFLVYVAYVVDVGGDYLHYYRFWMPVFPLLVALAVAGLARTSRSNASRVAWFAAGLVLAASSLGIAREQWIETSALRSFLSYLNRGCNDAKRTLRPDDAIATAGIGFIKYCTRLTVIDILGLTDEQVGHRPVSVVGLRGHEKHDTAYVMARWPALIEIPPFPDTIVAAINEMHRDPNFLKYYRKTETGYLRLDRGIAD